MSSSKDTHAAPAPAAPASGAPKAPQGKGAKVKALLAGGIASLRGIAKGLTSPDRATRRMSMFFFACVFGVIGTLISAWQYWTGDPSARHGGQALTAAEMLEKQAEDEKHHEAANAATLTIGTFMVELKIPDGQKKPPGTMGVAEVEVVAVCDNSETCEFIKSALIQVKGQMTNAFVAIEREELMSKSGKARLRRNLAERLNEWLPHGKVEDIFFSKVIVN